MSDSPNSSTVTPDIQGVSLTDTRPRDLVHIANVEQWLAICTAPDFCKVGSSVVAFNSFAYLDYPKTASPNVNARGKPVYRQHDILQKVQGDAGQHIVSGTSLSSGHVKILEGHPKIKVNKRNVARQDSKCLINCSESGIGGADGRLLTTKKGSSPSVTAMDSDVLASPRSSARLQELLQLREELEAKQINVDRLDDIVNFEEAHEFVTDLVGHIHGTDGQFSGYASQASRGVLGFFADFGLGVLELGYEVAKSIPKGLQQRATITGLMISQVNTQIFAENLRLGNYSAAQLKDKAKRLGNALVLPITDPWQKDQYVESVTRGILEVLTLSVGGAGKAGRLARLSSETKAAELSSAGTAASRVPITKSAATSAAADEGVFVKARKKPEFSGNWDNYKTEGILANPIKSPEGGALVSEFERQGMSRREAITKAADLMRTGSTLPIAKPFTAGTRLYKVVSAGGSVGPNSAFWATIDRVEALKGLPYDTIANRLGLPLASQQGEKFEVWEIRAKRPGTYFDSKIAPTREVGADGSLWEQAGGDTQSLVPDRSLFGDAIKTGIVIGG